MSAPVPSPYRFTVSVEEDVPGGMWCIFIHDATSDSSTNDLLFVAELDTEAEAHRHAALVLAALHQATLDQA